MIKQTQQVHSDPRTNLLLARLNSEDYQSLMAKGKVVTLKLGKRLYNQDDPINAIYFPLTCMVCLLVSANGKEPRLEMAIVGKEGVVGAAEVFHSQGALGIHVIQLPGTAFRVPAESFQEETRSRPLTQKLFGLHLYALTRQILQGGLCNHVHIMAQRCARWLLITHDQAGEDSFPITQEFLSHMLGVRRATVNEAIGVLRQAALIRFTRGKLTVLDRHGLESASCECYEAVKRVYEAVMTSKVK